jgi:NhaP-type Na+/H+ or K+/H+ antiporter
MIPVVVSLIGTRLRADTALVMGWFGPRGLASVVFTLMAYESFEEAGRGFDTLAHAAAWTVLLSVVLHGVSAVPLANWYARRLETAEAAAPELVVVPDLGVRRPDPLSWLKHHRQEAEGG